MLPELQKAGWWGLVEDRSITGTDDPVFVGERRLRTIFGTNMRVSRAAGQWARIQAVKDRRPWLRYSAVLDRRTRPSHALWHATILPVDHPWWRTHFPPNGWNCRCTVTQWSDADLASKGWKPTDPADLPPDDPVGNAFFGRRDGDGNRKRRDVRPGIDPGWDYHPGDHSLQGMAEAVRRSLDASLSVGLDRSAARTLDELVRSSALDNHLRVPPTAAAIGAMKDEEGQFFPMTILSQSIAEALGTKSRVGLLSAATWAKQLSRHDELGRDFYAGLAKIFDHPYRAYQRPDGTLVVFVDSPAGLVRMAMKRADEGRETFINSAHFARKRDESSVARVAELVDEAR